MQASTAIHDRTYCNAYLSTPTACRQWHMPSTQGRGQASLCRAMHSCCRAAARIDSGSISRRDVALLTAAAWSIRIFQPQGAKAEGFPSSLFEAFSSPVESFPEPIRFPRKALSMPFAVLLVRSVYEAVDAMDFIPMSDFQASFWKYRQSQYEPYLLQYSPLRVRQGDLTDPLYFDFISFAQMATINQEIPRGRQVFEEFSEESPNQKKLVTRNPLIADNVKLPLLVQQCAGDNIFTGLRDGFREELFGGPTARSSDAHLEDLARDVQQILDIFVSKGYAIKAEVGDVKAQCSEGSCALHGARGSPGTFTVRVDGPANLWGLGALASQGSKLKNCFEGMAIEAYFRASGCSATYTHRRTDTSVFQEWTIA